jgi:hypothetical protein
MSDRDVFSRCAAGNPVIFVSSLRGNLLLRPVELGSVDPHAVQNDRELARDGDLGLSEPISLGEPHPPSLYHRPFRHDAAGCPEGRVVEGGEIFLGCDE